MDTWEGKALVEHGRGDRVLLVHIVLKAVDFVLFSQYNRCSQTQTCSKKLGCIENVPLT